MALLVISSTLGWGVNIVENTFHGDLSNKKSQDSLPVNYNKCIMNHKELPNWNLRI